jgi:hypothetical protein
MTFDFHEAASVYVRFISVKDDKVTTIQSGAYLMRPDSATTTTLSGRRRQISRLILCR